MQKVRDLFPDPNYSSFTKECVKVGEAIEALGYELLTEHYSQGLQGMTFKKGSSMVGITVEDQVGPQCPICGQEIDHLRCARYHTARGRASIKEKFKAVEIELNDESNEVAYSCPHCFAFVTNDSEEARRILLGVI